MAWLNDLSTKDVVVNFTVKEQEVIQKENRDQEMELQRKRSDVK